MVRFDDKFATYRDQLEEHYPIGAFSQFPGKRMFQDKQTGKFLELTKI